MLAEQAVAVGRYAAAARLAGAPVEQVKRFMAAGYVAQPRQLAFHAVARECDKADGPEWVLFGGARGPGKSHASFAQVMLDDCQRAPGIKALFLRSIQKGAAEAFEDLSRAVLSGVQGWTYKKHAGVLEWENGSRVLLGGLRDEGDVGKYIGLQYDLIAIEELTTLTWKRVELLLGSLRTSRTDWRPRLYATTNPGGVGHGEVKTRFVEPWKAGREDGNTRFVPATHRDNRFLDEGYLGYLTRLSGALGKAWRDGDWDVFEGQAFASWSFDRHVVEPFEIPAHWLRLRAIDWGYSNPFCCLWLAIDPDNGRVVVYRELYQTGLTDRQQARTIAALTLPSEKIGLTFADPSMWAAKTAGEVATSTVSEYLAEGIALQRADNDRLTGKRKVDRLLADLPDGRPGLLVFRTCTELVRTLPTLPFDRRNVEDVDSGAEDHAYDTLRYGLTSLQAPGGQRKTTNNNPWTQIKHF